MKTKRTAGMFLLTMILTICACMSVSAKTVRKRTVKMKGVNGTYTYSSTYKGERLIYHKFKVGQTGVMRITGYELTKRGKKNGFNITLCGADKKRVDVNPNNYVNYAKGTIQYYVLQKGTYYLKMKPSASKKGLKYIIQAKFTKMGQYVAQTGDARERAVYMAKDTSAYAYITALDAQGSGRWLYFYTDGEDPIELTFIPQLPKSNQGTFTACIYGPSYKDGKVLEISSGGDRYKLSTTVTTKKGTTTTKKTTGLKKGYYYIRVYRENSTQDNIRHGNGYIKVTRR